MRRVIFHKKIYSFIPEVERRVYEIHRQFLLGNEHFENMLDRKEVVIVVYVVGQNYFFFLFAVYKAFPSRYLPS